VRTSHNHDEECSYDDSRRLIAPFINARLRLIFKVATLNAQLNYIP